MALPLPDATITPGPAYASQISALNNSCFSKVDAHTHTGAGNADGIQIPTAGLNLNADLTFNSHAATNLYSVGFVSQGSSLTGAGFLSMVAGDLWWNNGSGTSFALTIGGSINVSGVGGITGLTGSAALTYTAAGDGNFAFTKTANTPADITAGNITVLKAATTSGPGVTMAFGGSGSYTWTFPASLPGSTLFLQMDTSGNVTANGAADGTTMSLSGGILSVIAAGIVDNATVTTSANKILINTSGVNTTQLAAGAVTQPKLAALPIAVSSSTGGSNFNTNSITAIATTASLTCTGRPVQVMMVPDGSGNTSVMAGNSGGVADWYWYRDTTQIAHWQGVGAGYTAGGPLSAYNMVDVNATAGTHTYSLRVNCHGFSMACSYFLVYAYEL